MKKLLLVLVIPLLVGASCDLFKKDTSKVVYVHSDTITQLPKPGLVESIVVDFSKCSKGTDTVYFGFGSSHFSFDGIENDVCIFHLGTEIENPNWDGDLNFKCSIPVSLGVKTYEVGDYGINWDGDFNKYCEE